MTEATTAFFGGSSFSLIISDFSSVGAGFSVGFANKLGILDGLSGVKREVGLKSEGFDETFSASSFFSSTSLLISASPKRDFSGLERVLPPKIEVTSETSFGSIIVSAAFHKFVVVGGVIGGFKKVSVFSFEFAAVL